MYENPTVTWRTAFCNYDAARHSLPVWHILVVIYREDTWDSILMDRSRGIWVLGSALTTQRNDTFTTQMDASRNWVNWLRDVIPFSSDLVIHFFYFISIFYEINIISQMSHRGRVSKFRLSKFQEFTIFPIQSPFETNEENERIFKQIYSWEMWNMVPHKPHISISLSEKNFFLPSIQGQRAVKNESSVGIGSLQLDMWSHAITKGVYIYDRTR